MQDRGDARGGRAAAPVGLARWRGGHARDPCATLRREGKTAMQQIVLDAEAGQVSAELARRGVDATARVHVLVEVIDTAEPPMAAIAQAGKGFDWLADEPDLYSDADLVERAV